MAKRGFVGTLMAGAALMLAPAIAGAQDVRDLDQESSNVRTFTGNVGSQAAVFEVNVAAGNVLKIDVIATNGMDPTVKVTDAVSGEVLGEDDDSGGDLNSRVSIRGQEARRIRIEVNRFTYEGMEESSYEGGDFELKLTAMQYSPQSVRPVTWGSALGGSLVGEDKHEFSFTGEQGQLLEVAMLAGEDTSLDPFLELRDDTGEVVASNDDSGGGLNARLRYVMQSGGTYTITASAYGEGGGDYTLRVGERREAIVQAPLQMIGFGDRMTGRLGAGIESGDIDPDTILYQLNDAAIARIIAGHGAVTIHMDADEGSDNPLDADGGNGLDPFVELGFDTPLGFAGVGSDDDGSGSLNAMLPIDLSSIADSRDLLARLRVRVKSYSGSGGAYTLRITEGMEARPVYDDAVDAAAAISEVPVPRVIAPPRRVYD